ncbi:hypothetical protein ELG83_26680 (plasmid) [Rhizobium leguminosarum]|uniref:Uncharacterized protein n=1 Tax=Rhizobium leguminosarum bv. viciae TaxID=387 RepID=A0A8G2MN80_RHILV|nr:hypothetical protein [Rhizobium leguminosarum bv. viciae]TBF23280.1 hypothetical protein ELG88_36935 [Rhizobium leguminosarum]NKK24131.1 hypothetical protein [Rhizobium leguminosarum bv. viciae]NKL19199.1 hypothetical protein [Rhizobium leguminosarum bv. viciae]NKL56420.1 hypothetical protein [Rhizobium leguminosarum bv. viciae]
MSGHRAGSNRTASRRRISTTAIPVPAERHRQQISTLSDAELVPLAKMGDELAIPAPATQHCRSRELMRSRAIFHSKTCSKQTLFIRLPI